MLTGLQLDDLAVVRIVGGFIGRQGGAADRAYAQNADECRYTLRCYAFR